MPRSAPLVWTSWLLWVLVACGGRTGSRPTAPPREVAAPALAPPSPPASLPAGHPRADLIPRAILFGNPERGAPTISPDGAHLAFTAPAGGVMNVFVAPAGGALDQAVQVTRETARPIRQFSWSADGRWLLFLQDQAGDENFHLWKVAPDGKSAPVDLTPGASVTVRLIGASAKRPGTILIGLNDRDPRWHDVYALDLASGERTLVLQNPGLVGFVSDDDLRLRFASRMEPDGSMTWLVPGKGAAWTPAFTVPPDDVGSTAVLGFDATGRRYYLLDARGRDRAAVFTVDAASKKATLVAEHPRADATGDLFTHPRTHALRAVAFEHLRQEWKVVDRRIGKDLAALAALDEGDLAVTSTTRADDVWIVGFTGDRRPARYWRWDRKAQRGTLLYAARPALDGLPLARMTPVVIPARDGLELVSYLSLPRASDEDGDGTPSAPQPMVLLVHGGPWSRDRWGYDPYAQLLADRGYAVLQVNFRGSTGFGKAFLNAGNRQWGKRMHDDLIDAVTWAVARGVTTADRVCIMGGSYGGYATLAGLTLTPRTFACGVDIVGVSDIATLIESVPPYWAPMLASFKQRIGDWTTPEGKAALREVSPLTHAARIERPLLIAQGANDPRVKKAQSDAIVTAMQQKGLPVTYVLFPDEGHGFARPENDLAFVAVAEAFLSAYLGGAYQPMTAADFAGSTIQILAGREGVPGLPASIGGHAPGSQPRD